MWYLHIFLQFHFTISYNMNLIWLGMLLYFQYKWLAFQDPSKVCFLFISWTSLHAMPLTNKPSDSKHDMMAPDGTSTTLTFFPWPSSSMLTSRGTKNWSGNWLQSVLNLIAFLVAAEVTLNNLFIPLYAVVCQFVSNQILLMNYGINRIQHSAMESVARLIQHTW